MSARAGDTFTPQAQPFHRYVVLTSPNDNGDVLIANFTTISDIHEDQGCVLQSADYPAFIKQPTTIRFNKASMVSAEKIRESEQLEVNEPVPAPTLLKVQRSGIESDFLAVKFQRLLRVELGVDADE